jgi:catechol 2,3-dioxygenase-like lactoylglutathione lyase family enzyme
MAVPTDPPHAVAAGPLRDAAIVAFVATTDLERAHAFYGGVLGLERIEESAYANAYDVGATSLRVTRVDRVAPAPYTVLGWRVGDVRRAIAGLAASGVAILRFSGLEQDPEGVWAAPGGARVAWFDDPDGNRLSVSEMPPCAEAPPAPQAPPAAEVPPPAEVLPAAGAPPAVAN